MTKLLTDSDIAYMLGLSRSWVRSQRFKRRHGESHVLTIDPVMVGDVPRYRAVDVHAWVQSLSMDTSSGGGVS